MFSRWAAAAAGPGAGCWAPGRPRAGWRRTGAGPQRPAVDDDLAAGGPDVPGEDLEQPVLALALQGGQPRTSPAATSKETPASCRSMRGRARPAAGCAPPRPWRPARGRRRGPRRRPRPAWRRRSGLPPSLPVEGGDVAAVAQDGAHVAVLADLGQPVGDEQHRPVALLPAGHDGEHPVRQVRRQGRRDLVEHQQLRVEGQRPGQVEHAQEGQGMSDLLVQVEAVQVHLGQLVAHLGRVGPGEPEVLGDGEVADHRRVLVDRGQAPSRASVAAQLDRGAVDGHRPESWWSTPVRILTRVDLPAPLAPSKACTRPGHRQVDRAQGDHGPKALATAVACRSGSASEGSGCRAHSPGPLQANSCSLL